MRTLAGWLSFIVFIITFIVGSFGFGEGGLKLRDILTLVILAISLIASIYFLSPRGVKNSK